MPLGNRPPDALYIEGSDVVLLRVTLAHIAGHEVPADDLRRAAERLLEDSD